MSYSVLATSMTPALIIYLLDVSASMSSPMAGPNGPRRRIDVVMDALAAAVRQMVFRSTKGRQIAPRYRIAMYAYSDAVYDVLEGIKGIHQVASLGVPELNPLRTTDTARAFMACEKLLETVLPQMYGWPAPLVCHLTDGEFTGEDPEPVVRRIMAMGVPDGNVLVENIFISDNLLAQPVQDPKTWPGILPETPLTNDYARKLRSISSPLPESYRRMMLENSYRPDPRAVMMLPGGSPELVAMGFQMSTATPVS